MRVQPAEDVHVEQIVELWKELMDFHRDLDPFYTRRGDGHIRFQQYVRSLISSEKGRVLVAIEGSTVLGYCIGEIAKHPPVFLVESYGLIMDMTVRKDRRNQGIGTQLLNGLLDYFNSQQVTRVELRVAASNPVGYPFWKKHGFKDYAHDLFLDMRP